jgi:hypothetical protein
MSSTGRPLVDFHDENHAHDPPIAQLGVGLRQTTAARDMASLSAPLSETTLRTWWPLGFWEREERQKVLRGLGNRSSMDSGRAALGFGRRGRTARGPRARQAALNRPNSRGHHGPTAWRHEVLSAAIAVDSAARPGGTQDG